MVLAPQQLAAEVNAFIASRNGGVTVASMAGPAPTVAPWRRRPRRAPAASVPPRRRPQAPLRDREAGRQAPHSLLPHRPWTGRGGWPPRFRSCLATGGSTPVAGTRRRCGAGLPADRRAGAALLCRLRAPVRVVPRRTAFLTRRTPADAGPALLPPHISTLTALVCLPAASVPCAFRPQGGAGSVAAADGCAYALAQQPVRRGVRRHRLTGAASEDYDIVNQLRNT